MDLPPILPERGKHKALCKHLNHLRSAILSLRPLQSVNTLTEGTRTGVYRQGTPKKKTVEGGGSIQWEGQWVDGAYITDDIVIRKQPTEVDNGVGATFIAGSNIAAGELPPGESAGSGATFTVNIVDGEIDSIDIVTPGSGYPTENVVITITGDGTDATATVEVTDGEITAITITNPGSGYTTAEAEIGAAGSQSWEKFAEFNNCQKYVLKKGKKKVELDVGRDGDVCRIRIFKDYHTAASGSILLDVDTLIGLVPEGVDMIMQPTLWDVCVDGENKAAVFISTEPFDPPA